MARPRYLTFEGMAPNGVGKQGFRIPQHLVEHVQRYDPPRRLFELTLVKELVQLPTVVFLGLERDELDDGLCYAGVPSGRYTNEGKKLNARPGRTFLVFFTADGELLDFRWSEEHATMAGYPADWEERFGEQKWPQI